MKKYLLLLATVLSLSGCVSSKPDDEDIKRAHTLVHAKQCSNIMIDGVRKINGYRDPSDKSRYTVEYEYSVRVVNVAALAAAVANWKKEKEYGDLMLAKALEHDKAKREYAIAEAPFMRRNPQGVGTYEAWSAKFDVELKDLYLKEKALANEISAGLENIKKFEYYNREEAGARKIYFKNCGSTAELIYDRALDTQRKAVKESGDPLKWFSYYDMKVTATHVMQKTEQGWRLALDFKP